MNVDYHAHTTYSDGRFMWSMCRAAEDAGLDGVGFADHCNVSTRQRRVAAKKALGFNLDATYERRRDAIEGMRERFDLTVYDAVEMDYDPRDRAEIEAFLDEAGFQYAIGSVHHLDGINVHVEPYFERKDDDERAALVDRFFERTADLFESGLFDVAAHVDLVERNPELRGFATEEHYRRVAEAAAGSGTAIEINAGRALGEYGEFHPGLRFLGVLDDYDVEYVLSTDAHAPDELRDRVKGLEKFVLARGLEPIALDV